VTLSDGVETIPITGGEAKGHANPHAWMSPAAAQVYVDNIAEAFATLDPAHAADYRANAAAYSAQIAALGDELERELASLDPARRALVTCEGAFSYLARDAGLAEAWLWPVNSERQGTPQQVAATIDFVRDNRVPAVFCESTVSSTAQEGASWLRGIHVVKDEVAVAITIEVSCHHGGVCVWPPDDLGS
jgi:manganese transport system substrate-binding protein